MVQAGHFVKILARNKEISFYLLDKFKLPYTAISTHKKNLLKKLTDYLYRWIKLYKICKKFQPDISIGFGDFILPQLSKVLGFKSIILTDIEYVFHDHVLAFPFSDFILTPSSYQKTLGKKQYKFNSYKELAYIDPKFKPDVSILNDLSKDNEKAYILIRFVSHTAVHDFGNKQLSDSDKILIVKRFLSHAKVFISSEDRLPAALEKYRLKTAPEKIHDVMYYASLFYGESSTMATEAACMGVPAIFIDSNGRGYTDELEHKYSLICNFRVTPYQIEKSIKTGIELISSRESEKHEQRRKLDLMIQDKENMLDFVTSFVERNIKI